MSQIAEVLSGDGKAQKGTHEHEPFYFWNGELSSKFKSVNYEGELVHFNLLSSVNLHSTDLWKTSFTELRTF